MKRCEMQQCGEMETDESRNVTPIEQPAKQSRLCNGKCRSVILKANEFRCEPKWLKSTVRQQEKAVASL